MGELNPRGTPTIYKDENIGIDRNIEGQKYENIGRNIGEISISIKP